MRQKIYAACSIFLSFFMMSCARDIDCAVTTFHERPLPQGESIRIEPLNPANRGSLEFKEYATMIATKLKAIGYVPVGSRDEAELIAEIDYKIESGQTKITRRPGSYVRYHFYYGRAYDPFYYGLTDFWEPPFYSETVYNRSLTLNIVRADGQTGPGRKVLFEGWVLSTGRESSLHGIMPYLITAIFTNFPGESGVSKIITIEKNH